MGSGLAGPAARRGLVERGRQAVRRTWWRAEDYAYAVQRQLGVRGGPDDLAEPERPVGPPVVLVPGVYEPWRFLRPLGVELHARGVRVHAVTALGNNRLPVPVQAAVLGDFLAARDLRGVVLVAHSKGGLIGKLAMLDHDPDGRIASMVAVNTPFGGSALARWLPLRPIRAFVPTDPTIVALAAELEVNARITSVRSFWDPHIPGGSTLVGSREVLLDTPGHFRPLADPQLVELLVDLLIETGPADGVSPGAP